MQGIFKMPRTTTTKKMSYGKLRQKTYNLNEHFNRNLPPVDIPILVELENGDWEPVIRKSWARSRSGNIEFCLMQTYSKIYIHSSKIKWKYQ